MEMMTQEIQCLFGLMVAFLALLSPVATQGASFDCAKASTKVEKMICADPELSKLDEELGRAYSETLKTAHDADALKQLQLEWMKERNACGDTDCVEMVYRSRIGELNSGQAEGRFLTVLAKNEQLCAEYKSFVEHEVAKREQPSRFFDSKPICEKHFGTDFPKFKSVQWREISPIEHPDLAVQAYRYIHYWPWNRKVWWTPSSRQIFSEIRYKILVRKHHLHSITSPFTGALPEARAVLPPLRHRHLQVQQ